MKYQVGDILKFIRHGAKPDLYCIILELYPNPRYKNEAKVYWLYSATGSPLIQEVNLSVSYHGMYERLS